MLSYRLKSLIKFVEKEDKIIDIGCDHALLDIELVKNNYVSNMIVSDIHKLALESGEKNIKAAKLTKKIDARLGAGLEVLSESDDINTIIISGMGTNTIIEILNNDYLEKINKLIIQSNNNHAELRTHVIKLGFYITDEEYFVDANKNYINIVFKRGHKKYHKDDLHYGPFLKNDPKYLEFELNNCLKIKKLIPNNKLKYQLKLDLEIKRLKKYLERSR